MVNFKNTTHYHQYVCVLSWAPFFGLNLILVKPNYELRKPSFKHWYAIHKQVVRNLSHCLHSCPHCMDKIIANCFWHSSYIWESWPFWRCRKKIRRRSTHVLEWEKFNKQLHTSLGYTKICSLSLKHIFFLGRTFPVGSKAIFFFAFFSPPNTYMWLFSDPQV